MMEPGQVSDTRAVFRQATECLIARHCCSTDEASERIRQEAMAKRATLDEVARAIIVGEPLSYRPSPPTWNEFVR
jgi:AmiR/NasT family two-component response regulator